MLKLQQGAVVWANLPQLVGRRPAVILTRDLAIGQLNTLTAAPLTRTIRNLPTEVILHPSDGVDSTSAISLDNILTLPRSALGEVVTVLMRERLLQVFQAIRIAFDMQ